MWILKSKHWIQKSIDVKLFSRWPGNGATMKLFPSPSRSRYFTSHKSLDINMIKIKNVKKVDSIDSKSTLDNIKMSLTKLSVLDLRELSSLIESRLEDEPMAYDEPSFGGKFEVYNQRNYSDDDHLFDRCMDYTHSYLLKWEDGEELVIIYGNREDVMWAGTTKFEVQALKIGPLYILATFPDDVKGIPQTCEGAAELYNILKKRNVESNTPELFIEDFIDFIYDILIDHNNRAGLLYGIYTSDKFRKSIENKEDGVRKDRV